MGMLDPRKPREASLYLAGSFISRARGINSINLKTNPSALRDLIDLLQKHDMKSVSQVIEQIISEIFFEDGKYYETEEYTHNKANTHLRKNRRSGLFEYPTFPEIEVVYSDIKRRRPKSIFKRFSHWFRKTFDRRMYLIYDPKNDSPLE